MKHSSLSHIFKRGSNVITVLQRPLAEDLIMGNSTFGAGRSVVAMVRKATEFAHCRVVGNDCNQSHSHPDF